MQIDVRAAEASLADIDIIVARLKQSAFYRRSGSILIIWGILVALGHVATQLRLPQIEIVWTFVDVLGLLATIVSGVQLRRRGAPFDWRLFVAIVLFFGFGLLCSELGHFGPRDMNAFWPILFMFGYALAGLWLGHVYLGLGIAGILLTFIGYVWAATWFPLYLAFVAGGGLVLAGLWMRRA